VFCNNIAIYSVYNTTYIYRIIALDGSSPLCFTITSTRIW